MVAGEWLERARRVLVGGVNSTVRAFTRPRPLIAVGGEGPYLYDAEYGRLLDYVMGYGPLIHGHAHPEVRRRVEEAIESGWLFGATTPLEVMLAEKILKYVYPGGKIRFVNSGTEATMLAVRLARAVTGREYIVKFDGCYHGAHDYVLVGAGSAAAHIGAPKSPGIPRCVAERTLVARYNDLGSVEEIFSEAGESIATVIVEPVIGNMGVIPPAKGFLEGLRRITRRHGALLIMDEVITGFRLAMGGAQEYYGVRADLVTLGKIIGGGFPVGAVAGPSEIMDNLTPEGKVFNAGTFNGHPASMAAGLATIELLERLGGPSRAAEHARALEDIIRTVLDGHGVTYALNRVESMLQFFVGVEKVESPEDARRADKSLYLRLHESLLRRGVLIAPSQFEAVFSSTVHGPGEAELFEEAFRAAAREVLGG